MDTGAGRSGQTSDPSGAEIVTGRKHPELLGMCDPVRARTAKYTGPRIVEGAQLAARAPGCSFP